MGGPKPILARGNSCRTAVASTCADECRSTSSACGSLSVTIATFAPSGSGRARSRTWPSTRTARAALASTGPIALARSAPVAPAGSRFSLPSGSVTRISAAAIGSGSRLGGPRRGRRRSSRGGGARDARGRRRQGQEAPPVAEVEHDQEENEEPSREPAGDAARGERRRFVGHGNVFENDGEGRGRTGNR